MNKCLNCGKECINKYCSVTCQNIYKGILNNENYKLNPSFCNNCGCKLEYEIRKNKFCSHSCSASINNKGVPRNIKTVNSIINTIDDDTFKKSINIAKSWKELSTLFGYKNTLSANVKQNIINRAAYSNLKIDFSKDLIKDKTKKEIFELSKNWQTARSIIRKDACIVFKNSNKDYKCIICGYEKHVDIAHIKPVSKFNDDSLIGEMNNIDNLIPLCPNHHWEYDNGVIKI